MSGERLSFVQAGVVVDSLRVIAAAVKCESGDCEHALTLAGAHQALSALMAGFEIPEDAAIPPIADLIKKAQLSLAIRRAGLIVVDAQLEAAAHARAVVADLVSALQADADA